MATGSSSCMLRHVNLLDVNLRSTQSGVKATQASFMKDRPGERFDVRKYKGHIVDPKIIFHFREITQRCSKSDSEIKLPFT